MKHSRSPVLEVTVFLTGTLVMIYEIVGSRMLGPYYGTSTLVWTTLIGVILASLAIGYTVGGKIADKHPHIRLLSRIIFLAGVCIGIVSFMKDAFLFEMKVFGLSIGWGALFSSIILFAPASILLGLTGPYATRLAIRDLESSGTTVGKFSGISTVGSIFGTFFAGFYLLPTFGTHVIVTSIAILLILLSLITSWKDFFWTKIILLGVLISGLLFFPYSAPIQQYMTHAYNIHDIDTAYNRVWIYDTKKGDNPVRVMGINNENHSSMYLSSPDLVNEYTKYYDLGEHFFPDFRKALILGGAGYSYPKHFLEHYKSGQTLDVIEIDPDMTHLAKQYFSLKDVPRLHIHHQDGRTFLSQAQKKSYDIAYIDAFGSYYSIPYQLTTRETVQSLSDILSDSGVVILNIISKISGTGSEFLRAEYRTYRSVFPYVHIYPVNYPHEPDRLQNIILIAEKGETKSAIKNSRPELQAFLDKKWKNIIDGDIPLLTDDYAPVDAYMMRALSISK